jgi:aminopeptidase N
MTRRVSLCWAHAACLLAPFACAPADPPLPDDSQPYDVTRYALRGEFDWERGRLLATVDITFKTDDPPQSSIILDTTVDVTAVRAADGAALEFFADPEAETLQIDIASLAGQGDLRVEVTYEAAMNEALRAWDARAGDPVTTRAVYTFSEPLDTRHWMPIQNRPDDRAEFSVELRMRSDEALIGNGALELDERDGDARRMRWATDYTLPPYLMAFAVGPFATKEGEHDDVPIGAWYRPGLDGDFDLVLSELGRMLSLYEPMLGPYPFEKYQLILLPAVGGGIEHASITFQSETSSNQPAIASDLQLTAHELVHQWWGDLVTVATWDDVWIKEGFATMLSTEALRRAEDQSDAGTLMGDLQSAASGAAIRDAALPPPEKYTSGPYGRSAWLLTQIRGVVGDDDFFAIRAGPARRARLRHDRHRRRHPRVRPAPRRRAVRPHAQRDRRPRPPVPHRRAEPQRRHRHPPRPRRDPRRPDRVRVAPRQRRRRAPHPHRRSAAHPHQARPRRPPRDRPARRPPPPRVHALRRRQLRQPLRRPRPPRPPRRARRASPRSPPCPASTSGSR